mmetsp:Transcript_8692/g.20441  ORF Transcript_8692/g.20441 Transcript_8692/m.20441 type:complete len:280 (-) Transcript_8692:675-1514(-)
MPPHAKAVVSSCTRCVRRFLACSCRLWTCFCKSSAGTTDASNSPTNCSCGSEVSCKCRVRLFSPLPHVDEQAPHSFQSPHMQYAGVWHCLVQFVVSSEACALQAEPPQLDSFRTWRKRLCCPPHLSQALQSPQSPQAQSCGSHSAEQGVRAQPSTSLSASAHGRPPKAGNATMSRERVREPPPQLEVQSPHSSQAATWQSNAGPVPQPCGLCCPGPGLQGEVCFMGPMQKAPSPRPWRAILRERRMTPSQSLVQSLHASQSPKMQSTDSTHETSSLQLA